jgi:hypothetical protein
MSGKKGVFFSIDALIALSIIVVALLIAYPLVSNVKPKTELHYDLLSTLSTIKISELDNSYAKSLMEDGSIKDPSKSVLEQIGEFYVTNKTKAELLAESTMQDLSEDSNIGIWFGETLIASRNVTPYESAKEIDVARQFISGIQEGKNITGYSARAYLYSSLQSDYFYFGGYTGDGNLSAKIVYNGTISFAVAEIAINEDFGLYVNGNFSGSYVKPATELTPKKYQLPIASFHSGENLIEFKPANLTRLRITGGFIKIEYDKIPEYDKPERKYFPGIDGIINLYSGFSIPTELGSMNLRIHFKSPYKMFVKIGSTPIFENTSYNGTTVAISDAELRSKLNYSSLGGTTTPLRIGLYAATRAGNADVVILTDLSGSMTSRLDSENNGVNRTCDDPLLYEANTNKVSLAKCLDKIVIDTLLEVPGNRVALAAFYGDEGTPNKGRMYNASLSSNITLLKSKIDAYNPQGGTCICCGINMAYKMLSEGSNSGRRKYIIVMSDGIPTHTCMAASGCTGTRTGMPSDEGLWLGASSGCYGGMDDCNVNDCGCAVTNTNWSACRAHNDLNSTLFSVGFGNVSTCALANTTLQSVAQCGEGEYFASLNSTVLKQFYTNISENILSMSYVEQIANATGNFTGTILYPDSYIELNYTREPQPFGLIATTEKMFENATSGTFSIPENSSIIKATAISYSGPRWTALVTMNGNPFYNLSKYGYDYTLLGDPYAIRIPNSLIQKDNLVEIYRGTNPDNLTAGSVNNKIIYTILKNASSYSPVCAAASGCNWYIEFDDGTNSTISTPSDYSGSSACSYSSGLIQFNENDAFQLATYNLLKKLDLNSNNEIDIKFNEQNLAISSSQLKGIPFLWETEVEARAWA